jgi:peptide/nickel transport system substrate-binding protein
MAVLQEETKSRLKRGFKKRRKEATSFGQQADEQIEKLLIRRFDRLISVKRFIFLWTTLFVLLFFFTALQFRSLASHYQTLSPVPGGIYSEGIIGSFSNANPIYASGAADAAVSRLVFSGLFKYNKDNSLVGDLAQKYTPNDTQTRYTVNLKHNITWHDGAAFTADDVVFTYQTIQNIEAQSSLYTNWQGIKVSKKDAYTVNFDLPNALSSFPYSMTNGIIPAHLFKKVMPAQMRSAQFNTTPVGTGPFEWKFVEVTGGSNQDRQQRISLSAFNDYWAGKPKLDGFSLATFSDDQHLLTAFNKKQLNAISGIDSAPDSLKKDSNIRMYRTPLTSGVMAFFNNSGPILGNVNIRRALVSGVDRGELSSVLNRQVNTINSPLLPTQLGYDPSIVQPSADLGSASQTLDKEAWVKGDSNIRSKDGQALKLSLAAQDTPEYTQVAQFLQRQWGRIGVKIEVHYYTNEDLQSAIIANHDYDILLYGISLGVDPDVFAYWDSSQASISSQGHLNLSEYKSKAADQALESARTRADPALRLPKYKIFLTNWVQDAPALALYQPSLLYISRGQVFNYEQKIINVRSDRFYNVNEWMVRQRHQTL